MDGRRARLTKYSLPGRTKASPTGLPQSRTNRFIRRSGDPSDKCDSMDETYVPIRHPQRRKHMLKKLSIALSVVAALGVGLALAAPQPAFAKDPPKKQKVQKKVYVKKNIYVKKNVQSKKVYVVGKSYNGHVYYGHSRHRWHGTWYDYGVGPCWINIGGIWFWNLAACP
jgi:hypothetical protein